MLLAGSFSEYPLGLLLEILLHKRETGLLEVSSSKQSGYFFIKEGEIRGGEVGKLAGARAVELAGGLVGASFRFEPIEPTDYARVVWEKSFGLNRIEADTPGLRGDFPTMLEQLLPSAEAAYGLLQRASVSLAQQARRLLSYAPAAYSSLEKAGVSIARRTLAYATTTYEFSKRAQVKRKLPPALRKALARWQIALRRDRELILKYRPIFSFQAALALIGKRAILPSRRQIVESNISFGVVVVAILVGIAVTISQILSSSQDPIDMGPADENIGTQSQSQPKPASRERAKSKPRIGRQRPAEKKRDARMTQEPMPRAPAERAPTKGVGDSDAHKKQSATSSGVQTIPVVLQIENGRVSQASLLKHRVGMERYEATALWIARQRRYPKAGKHTETVVVKVTPNPN